MNILTTVTNFQSFLESAGLHDAFSQLFLVFMIILFVSIITSIMRAPILLILLVNTLLLILATALGMIPIWIIIGITLAATLYSFMVLGDIPLGGGGS